MLERKQQMKQGGGGGGDVTIYIYMYILYWLVVLTILKNISQWEG